MPYPPYETVCKELDRRRRIAFGFERIEALLKELGDPHRSLQTVQVVGTNGKGTTAVSLAGALEAAGHTCGAYLSPHVVSYTERVVLRGRYASESKFAAAMWRAIETADAKNIPATQFELLTAGALHLFRESGVEWAVLEAGLGARHDATSAAEARAVVLTNVGLDHTEYLGETIEKIAQEKLASLKPGAVLILGTDDPRVVEVARREAGRAGASIIEHGGRERPDAVAFLPPYLARNVRLGMRVAEVLLGCALEEGEKEAASQAVRLLPARFEEHELCGVPVVVDGGHNPEGLEAALEAVRSLYRGRPLGVVFGVLREKDVASMLGVLGGEVDALVLTCPVDTSGRALDPEQVREGHSPRDVRGRMAQVVVNVADALDVAVREMKEAGGVVLVTGSLGTGAGALGRLRGQ